MRILSLNCWGGALYERLLPYLAEVDADVVCLQEVSRSPRGTPDWLDYEHDGVILPQRANLFDALKASLPDHDAFFFPFARGPLPAGSGMHWQSFGLATFVRSSLAITGQTLDFVHEAYSPNAFGPHPRARNVHGVRVFDHESQKSLAILQLHGLREISGKGDTAARAGQSKRLVEIIRAFQKPNEAVVLCGDLNLLPDSQTFDDLKALGLEDLVTKLGFTDTRTSHYAKSGRYADYLLVNAHVEWTAFDVVAQPEVSDHRPLLLTLR